MNKIFALAALAALMIGCSSATAPAASAPTAAPAAGATTAAPAATAAQAQPTSAPVAANANAVGGFSKTDPQLAPAGVTGDAARGAKAFTQKGIECDGCHDPTQNYPGGDFGPNMANVSTIATSVLKNPEYKGKAKTVAEYLRESILAPNVFIVPGDDYKEKDGTSAMKQDFAQKLTPQQVEDLIAYLLSLKAQ